MTSTSTAPSQNGYYCEPNARRFEPGLTQFVEGQPAVLFRPRPNTTPRSLAMAVRAAVKWFSQNPYANPKLAGLDGSVRTKIRPDGVEVHWWSHTEGRFSDYAEFSVPARHN